jgi:hypothetical protein
VIAVRRKKMYNLRSMCEMYSYKKGSDNIYLIFSDYVLDSRLEKETLNELILLELGERKCYWRHTDLLKTSIDNWFKTHEYNIKKLVDTTEFKYNPIYTKDYYEDFISNKNKDRTQSEDNTDTTTSINTTSENSSSTNEVSAYDSQNYQPQDKNTASISTTSNSSSLSNEDKDLSENVKEGLGSKLHHYGKNNDESYADIIEDERRLSLFNIYDWIIGQLDNELLIGIF